jgi:1,4-alpha-glucan branching enzyme
MKTLKQSNRSPLTVREPSVALVHFDYMDKHASSVCIAGTFNDWHPSATPMSASCHGHWEKDVALPPGVYEYALIVDGHWKLDPRCAGKKENPFGGLNSVLRVPAAG